MSAPLDRRGFIRRGAGIAAGAAGLWLAPSVGAADRPVRIGIVGVGRRGAELVRVLLDIEGVSITALCDIDMANLDAARAIITRRGLPEPDGYLRGPRDFERMIARDDLDAVITATPWEWHVPVMVAAMKAGKYGGVEVPACVTLDECWELVETSESTGMPCMLLENVNYFRNVMMVLVMVRRGLFGEMLHCEAGYQHDVRNVKFDTTGALDWRGRHAVTRDGNLYPTHAIGPVAWWLDINRGDRFDHLVSMSSKSRGMNDYIAEKFGPDHPNARMDYALGDINTTLIKTHNGCTVTLYHDTQSPRPYDLILRAQGTRGIYSGTLDKFYIEGRSPGDHEWEDTAAYAREYDHPLWRRYGDTAMKYGHGGADYLTMLQFVEAVRARTQTPIDVYDAATWSVISALTERSVARGSAPVAFPDFTRGRWMTTPPVGIPGE